MLTQRQCMSPNLSRPLHGEIVQVSLQFDTKSCKELIQNAKKKHCKVPLKMFPIRVQCSEQNKIKYEFKFPWKMKVSMSRDDCM